MIDWAMTAAFATTIIQVITPILTLVTLWFLWRQTRDLTAQTRNNATATTTALYEEIATHMLEIDRVLIDYPHLRPYLTDNQPIETLNDPVECQRLMAIAEMYIDFFDLLLVMKNITRSYKTDSVFAGEMEEWDNYIIDLYASSPAVRSLYCAHRDWYDEGLRAPFERAEAQRQAERLAQPA